VKLIPAALASGRALLARHVLVSGVNFAATIILAWLLTPSQYGIFALTLPPVTAAVLLLDLGLSAALVRETDARMARTARAIFWFEAAAGAVFAVAIQFLAPLWRRAYGLEPGLENVLRLHAFALLALPFRNVAVAHLERAMAFRRVAGLEVAEALSAQAIVLGLAFAGAGPYALAAGPVVRAVIGAVVAPVLAGFSPGAPRLDWSAVRGRLSFGIPFQANAFVNFGRDAALPLVVGAVAGEAAVGYVNWATSVANYPGLLLLNVSRLFYPLFVRARRARASMRPAVETAIAVSVWGVGALCVPLLGLADPLVRLIFAERWFPAIPLFYFLVPINVFLALLVPATAYLNSAGLPHVRLAYALAGGVVLWAGALGTVRKWGMLGYVASNVAMNLVESAMLREVARRLGGLALPWRSLAAAAACALLLLAGVRAAGVEGWAAVIGWGIVGAGAYLLAAGFPRDLRG